MLGSSSSAPSFGFGISSSSSAPGSGFSLGYGSAATTQGSSLFGSSNLFGSSGAASSWFGATALGPAATTPLFRGSLGLGSGTNLFGSSTGVGSSGGAATSFEQVYMLMVIFFFLMFCRVKMGKLEKRSREEVESDEYVSADDNLDELIHSEGEEDEDVYDDGEMNEGSEEDSESEEDGGEMREGSDEDLEEGEEDGGEMLEGSDEDLEEGEENAGEMLEGSDEDLEEGEENAGEMHVGSDEDLEEGEENDAAVDGEMEELENEYTYLRHQEQDLLANLKRQKGEDYLKGQAVKNQKTLWNKSLELRFLLQKPFSSSNRLPQEPARSLFVESDEGVSEAYTELIRSSEKTIDSLLELQNALLENNPYITQATDGNSQSSKKLEHDDMNPETDDKWKLISEMQSRMVNYRDRSIDKWQRKTQVTNGVASIKGRYQAFNQNISQQVAAYMRDPSRMIKQMQARRSTLSIFGAVPEEIGNVKGEDADGDPDLLDDGELYQQLLKEFFETFDPSATEAALYNLKRSQAKKRKIVDRRASKSRKIRYTVHEKIVNFMAPEPANIPPMAPKLFENLFGLKSRMATCN